MSGPALVLIGIPGSGKSTVGARLAAAFGVALADLDDLVETEFDAPAPEVFATRGEPAYRAVEERVALVALAGSGVVALSSGVIESERVRQALAELPVVWLRVSVTTATRRLSMNRYGMAALVAIRDRMDAMLEQRAPWYEAAATLAVDTDRRSAEQVASAILDQGVQP